MLIPRGRPQLTTFAASVRLFPGPSFARNDAKHVDLSCPVRPDPRKLVMKIGNPLNSLNVVDLAENNGVSLIHSLSCSGTWQVLGTIS